MINLKLSSLLTTIAEICKYDSGEIDKVINLSKAARTIRDYGGDISKAFHDGKIRFMPGIDDFAYGLIKEYFENGKIFLSESMQALIEEYLYYPESSHDDLLDALEMSLQFVNRAITNRMNLQSLIAVPDKKEFEVW